MDTISIDRKARYGKECSVPILFERRVVSIELFIYCLIKWIIEIKCGNGDGER